MKKPFQIQFYVYANDLRSMVLLKDFMVIFAASEYSAIEKLKSYLRKYLAGFSSESVISYELV